MPTGNHDDLRARALLASEFALDLLAAGIAAQRNVCTLWAARAASESEARFYRGLADDKHEQLLVIDQLRRERQELGAAVDDALGAPEDSAQ